MRQLGDTQIQILLDEPCPCDDCPRRRHCAATGDACEAYRLFYYGKSWGAAPRSPTQRLGARILG